MRTGIVVAALLVAGAAFAQEKGKERVMESKPVEVGAEAPDFRLNDHQGNGVRLSPFRGKKWVVLAFYPKAMTGG